MNVLGMAAAKARILWWTGAAGAAARLLTAPVYSEDQPILEWLLRSLIALFRIALGWPPGTQLTIGEILVQLFGKEIAVAVEDALKVVTDLPKLLEPLYFILKWAEVLFIVAMFLGIIVYWTVYTKQAGKSTTMLDKIWGGRTLIVDPFNWFIKRLLPITAIAAISMRIMRTFVVEGWKLLNWVINFTYEEAGTTAGAAFEDTLMSIAESGAFGLMFFLIVLAVIFIFSLRLLFIFIKRTLSFVLANFFILWDAGKFLDGSRLKSMADPLKDYLESFLLVAGTVLFIWLAPLAASRFPGVVGAFVLVAMLEVASTYPRLIDKWFGHRFEKLRGQLDTAGDWIDEDIVEARAREALAEPKPRILRRVTGWTSRQVSESTPEVVKFVAKAGLEAAKLEPHVAAGLAATKIVTDTAKSMRADKKAAGRAIHDLSTGKGLRSVLGLNPATRASEPSPQWDRDEALAQTVAERSQLYSLLGDLEGDLHFATFYELAKAYASRTTVGRMEDVVDRITFDLQQKSEDYIKQLAARGRKVADSARKLRESGG